MNLPQVMNAQDFWTWTKKVLVPGLYNSTWYNGNRHGATGFCSDRTSVIIGVARLRQLRVKSGKPLNRATIRCGS